MSAFVMRDSVTYFASTNVCGTKNPVLCSIISVENALTTSLVGPIICFTSTYVLNPAQRTNNMLRPALEQGNI